MKAKPRKVAIVGAGMAGLAAARALCLRGIEVDLFEANAKVGGCCATTRVDGYTFNDGALFLALPGMLDRLFERLQMDRATLVPLQRVTALQRAALPGGSVVTFDSGDGVRVEGRGDGATAQARTDLERFLAKWDPLLRAFADDILLHPLSLPRLLAKAWRHLGRLRGTAAAHLERDFGDEAVRAAMAATLLYTGVAPDKAPAAALLGLAAMFRDGYFMPEGGMGAIPEALAHAARQSGARIHFGTRATRILLAGGRVRGVEVEGEGLAEADAVVSTVSAMATLGGLLARDDVPRRLARKARRAPLSHQGFVVQLGLTNRIGAASYANYVLASLRGAQPEGPIFMVPTTALPQLAPPGGSIVELFPPIPQDRPADSWTPERKEEVARHAIERLSAMHDLDIAVQRVVSPREFLHDLHLHAGALYGLSPAAGPGALFAHRTPIAGLYQAGQTTWPGFGVASAGLSGLMAAEALLRE